MAGSTSYSKSSVRRQHEMPFGAQFTADGVTFNLWAPTVQAVELCLYKEDGSEEIVDMERGDGGWFTRTVSGVGHRQKYHFIVGDLRVPDPASRQQDDDVHGPSVVIDPSYFNWTDEHWLGLPWTDTVLYELHVGTFSKDGTFRGVIEKLDYLKDLGVTAIELMPISDFPGKRNWGYDGVLHFAPDRTYGTPDDLKALIDATHAHGMMIFLDVVYNHFGPEGNYLWVHSKDFFTDKYKTPWGAAIDFEGPQSATVRNFFVENAVYWLNEYNFDGLRFDAVHAIFDKSERQFLEELADSVRERLTINRMVHLVLENDDNNASLLEHNEAGQPKHFTAQWNDDFHHCVHVLATGENSGYYLDYSNETSFSSAVEHLARVLAEGFAYQGEASEFRSGGKRGMKSAHLPPTAFVSFMQNHDQIGNRAFGDRIAKLAKPDALKAITAITLLAPQIPMLFMGEEWASKTPFCFFCDFGPELAPLVSEGRREEFAKFDEFKDEKKRELIPDPIAEQTFVQSVLDWSEREQEAEQQHLLWVRNLLKIRADHISPLLRGVFRKATWRKLDEKAIEVRWQWDHAELLLLANLGDEALQKENVQLQGFGEIFSCSAKPGAGAQVAPWSVRWLVKDAK